MEIDDAIRNFVLQNAIRYKGKASPGAIIGKVLGEFPEWKDRSKELAKKVQAAVKGVNSLSQEQQLAELKERAPEMLEKKEKEKRGLPPLPNAVEGKVVTRIPPEPSKYNHIGHALSFLINYTYAKRYKGKSVLRFEDTNPEKAAQEYVDAMREDVLDYLGIKPDRTVFVSDDMEKFYSYAQKLISMGEAYVCSCAREKMQDLRRKGQACACRGMDAAVEWKAMLGGKYRDGERVLRLKGDMESKNTVMRDPVLFRIVSTPHYRQKGKYRVWPMYDFENAVEEDLCGITHILRSNEFGTMRVELQSRIKQALGLKDQTVVQYGRFNITGAVTQGREVRQLIEEGKVMGWDDPSLVTLRALRRRGFVREMYYELMEEVGITPSQTKIDWTLLSTINRRILDPVAERFFMVHDGVEVVIRGAPSQEVELDLHPDSKEGGRKMRCTDRFILSKSDVKKLKEGKLYRLMGCLNFTKQDGKFIFQSTEHEKYKDRGSGIMHWLPAGEKLLEVEVLMPDRKVIRGVAEPATSKVKVGAVIQFERFGFARLDSPNKFWFTHK